MNEIVASSCRGMIVELSRHQNCANPATLYEQA